MPNPRPTAGDIAQKKVDKLQKDYDEENAKGNRWGELHKGSRKKSEALLARLNHANNDPDLPANGVLGLVVATETLPADPEPDVEIDPADPLGTGS